MKNYWALLLAFFLAVSTSPFSQADIIEIPNAFSKYGASNESKLDSLLITEDIKWLAPEVAIIHDNGVNYASFTAESTRAKFPVHSDMASLRIETKLLATKKTDFKEATWVGIGMGTPQSLVQWEQGIFVIITTERDVQCLHKKNDLPERLIRKKITAIEGYNTVAISYEKSENTVSVHLNGEQIVDHLNLAKYHFIPEINYAGFFRVRSENG